MPDENDLEGRQDMGGKHGGQAGQPKSPAEPEARPHDKDVVAKRHTGQTDPPAAPTNKR